MRSRDAARIRQGILLARLCREHAIVRIVDPGVLPRLTYWAWLRELRRLQ